MFRLVYDGVCCKGNIKGTGISALVSYKNLHPYAVPIASHHVCPSSPLHLLLNQGGAEVLLAHQGKEECGGSRGAMQSGLLQCVMWYDQSFLKANRIACNVSFLLNLV